MGQDQGDKRSVSTDALETLGTIIGESEKRDAIHLAVAPITAAEKLFPGQDVGIEGTAKDPVGIVDPFLSAPVFPGQRFWLVIYPRQIHSLRHVWTHILGLQAEGNALRRENDALAGLLREAMTYSPVFSPMYKPGFGQRIQAALAAREITSSVTGAEPS